MNNYPIEIDEEDSLEISPLGISRKSSALDAIRSLIERRRGLRNNRDRTNEFVETFRAFGPGRRRKYKDNIMKINSLDELGENAVVNNETTKAIPSEEKSIAELNEEVREPLPTEDGNEASVKSFGKIDQAISDFLTQVEGDKPFKESNGRVSRWGIGNNEDQETPETLEEAAQVFQKDYVEKYPAIKNVWGQLKDPKDRYALGQYLIHRPAWASAFVQKWDGEIGGDSFRNALLRNQKLRYDATKANNPKYGNAFYGRITKAQNYNPNRNIEMGEEIATME